MMQLTQLEYSVLMQAIENAKNEVEEDTFIDPYSNEDNLTNKQVMEALETAGGKLYAVFTNLGVTE